MAGHPFQYATVRVVPRVERGESVNAGVILLCRPKRFLAARVGLDPGRLGPAQQNHPRVDALAARVGLDPGRLAALAPGVDPATIETHLRAIERIARGDADAGPIAALGQGERFHWLVAPSSTVIQPSEVHTGLCDDPAEELDHLFDRLVR
jgi:hypothetical protein